MVIFIYVWMLFGIGGITTATAENNFPEIGYDSLPDVLPGTKPLILQLSPEEVSATMLEGAHRLIDKEIKESPDGRSSLWDRNFSSSAAYEASVEPNRQRLMKYIGVVDKNIPPDNYNVGLPDKHPGVSMQKIAVGNDPVLVAETERYRIYQVKWPVLNRVHGEGLLLQPKS